MQNAKTSKSQRSDPRGPFVFETRTLGSSAVRQETRVVLAPAGLGSGMVRVPEGGEMRLEVQLEEVSEGVLVTASVTAPLAGECARCLDEFTSTANVSFQELFTARSGDADQDGYLLHGDLLDLEPAIRDAVVLDLPLSPLCASDCAGLCASCGVRLSEAGPDHRHEDDGGVWSVLRDLFGQEQAEVRQDGTGDSGSAAAGAERPDNGSPVAGTSDPAGTKER